MYSKIEKMGFKPVGPQGFPPSFWRNEEKGVCFALEDGTATFRAYSSSYPSQDFVITNAAGKAKHFRKAVSAAQAALES